MEHINGSKPIRDNSTSMNFDGWYLLPTVITVPTLGIPANGLVIHLLLGKPGICSTPEIFTLQMASFDIMFCFLLVIEFISFVYSKRFEDTFFMAWALNQTGGPMLLCLLSLDNYIAVCLPLVFHHLKDCRVRLAVCLLVCAITSASCYLVKTSETQNWSIIMGLMLIAILVISACTINVLRFLCKSGPNRKKIHPAKRRASKLILTSYVLLIFHYIPTLINYQMIQNCPEYEQSLSVLSGVSYSFLAMTSFTQPLSYLVRTRQIPKIRFLCDSAAKAKNNGLEKSDDPHG